MIVIVNHPFVHGYPACRKITDIKIPDRTHFQLFTPVLVHVGAQPVSINVPADFVNDKEIHKTLQVYVISIASLIACKIIS